MNTFNEKVIDLQTMLQGENGNTKSHFYLNIWAQWIRREHHIGTCSNRIESIHIVINRSLGACHSFESKLDNMISNILQLFNNYNKRN